MIAAINQRYQDYQPIKFMTTKNLTIHLNNSNTIVLVIILSLSNIRAIIKRQVAKAKLIKEMMNLWTAIKLKLKAKTGRTTTLIEDNNIGLSLNSRLSKPSHSNTIILKLKQKTGKLLLSLQLRILLKKVQLTTITTRENSLQGNATSLFKINWARYPTKSNLRLCHKCRTMPYCKLSQWYTNLILMINWCLQPSKVPSHALAHNWALRLNALPLKAIKTRAVITTTTVTKGSKSRQCYQQTTIRMVANHSRTLLTKKVCNRADHNSSHQW